MNQLLMVYLALTLFNAPTEYSNHHSSVSVYDNTQENASSQVTQANHTFDNQISLSEPSVILENGQLKFYFATGKAEIANNANDRAHEIIEAAKQGKKLGISGYTSSEDNPTVNAKLSKERGRAVKNFLVSNGIPERQIDFMKPNNADSENDGRLVTVFVVEDDFTNTISSTLANVPE